MRCRNRRVPCCCIAHSDPLTAHRLRDGRSTDRPRVSDALCTTDGARRQATGRRRSDWRLHQCGGSPSRPACNITSCVILCRATRRVVRVWRGARRVSRVRGFTCRCSRQIPHGLHCIAVKPRTSPRAARYRLGSASDPGRWSPVLAKPSPMSPPPPSRAVPRVEVLRDGATGGAGRADATFWKRFARHAWEQAPVCLEGAVAPAFVRPDELFAALVRVAGAHRAEARTAQVPGERAVGVRFKVDDATRLIDTGPCLPAAADGSLARYVPRITGELGDRRFELIVHDVHAYDLILWRRVRRFLRGLYAEVGVPVDAAEAVVFLRNDEATSFGVHRDEASVFMFPVHGRKRLLAWPPTQGFGFCAADYRTHRVSAEERIDEPSDRGPVELEIARRPYSAAGALYELELYVVAAGCDGLAPGMYHPPARTRRGGRRAGRRAARRCRGGGRDARRPRAGADRRRAARPAAGVEVRRHRLRRRAQGCRRAARGRCTWPRPQWASRRARPAEATPTASPALPVSRRSRRPSSAISCSEARLRDRPTRRFPPHHHRR